MKLLMVELVNRIHVEVLVSGQPRWFSPDVGILMFFHSYTCSQGIITFLKSRRNPMELEFLFHFLAALLNSLHRNK